MIGRGSPARIIVYSININYNSLTSINTRLFTLKHLIDLISESFPALSVPLDQSLDLLPRHHILIILFRDVLLCQLLQCVPFLRVAELKPVPLLCPLEPLLDLLKLLERLHVHLRVH